MSLCERQAMRRYKFPVCYNRSMYFDEATITVRSGNGGDGAVHFRREKYIPRGGPDGGDGGRGGDVVLSVDPRINTLQPFARRREFVAESGKNGTGTRSRGKS